MDLYDYVNIYVRVLHRRPVYPGLHPSKQVPLALLQCVPLRQKPHFSLHSYPYVPLSQAVEKNNYILVDVTFHGI